MKGLVKQWVLGLYSDRSGTVIVLFQIKASCITALMSNDPVSGLTEIESLCMNCMKNGTTRLLLTTIPHFRGKSTLDRKWKIYMISISELS